MVKKMQCSTVCLLHCQEDVFQYYANHRYGKKTAWAIMQKICAGEYQPFFAEHTAEMVNSKDTWLLNQINRPGIKLLPKAHAVEYILHQLKRLL